MYPLKRANVHLGVHMYPSLGTPALKPPPTGREDTECIFLLIHHLKTAKTQLTKNYQRILSYWNMKQRKTVSKHFISLNDGRFTVGDFFSALKLNNWRLNSIVDYVKKI